MFLYTLIHLFIYLFFFFSLAPSVFYCQFFPHLNNSPYSLDWALCWFLDFSVCPSYFYPSQNAGLFTPGWFFFSGGFDHGRAVNDLVPCPRSIYFACEFPIFRTPVSLADFSMCLCVAWESFCLVVSSSAFFFCRVVEQFLYSSVCTSPRLRLYGPFRCLLYLYPLPVGYRNWKSNQGHFVSLSFTPSPFRSSIPCKDKRYLVFFSFLSFLPFLPSFLPFLSLFSAVSQNLQKKKITSFLFFSVLNFSAWSISNVLIIFSLLLIFFFNWILSF